MTEIKLDQRIIDRRDYGFIGLIDFNADANTVNIWNKDRLYDEIMENTLSPEIIKLLSRIFKYTSGVNIYVFSKKVQGAEQIREFLDSIVRDQHYYSFLTVLSTCTDEEGIDQLISWATENRRIYLQTSTDLDFLNGVIFDFLLNNETSPYSDVSAAVRIARYFSENFGDLKINNLIDEYRFNDGVSLTELLYHTLLETELQRGLLRLDSLEEEYVEKRLKEVFDKAVSYLGQYFKDSAEFIDAAVIENRAKFYYSYQDEEFGTTI